MLFVGDKIKVPDNPDIVPWDIGVIKHMPNSNACGLFADKNCDFVFFGQVGIFPLSIYKANEIERLQ